MPDLRAVLRGPGAGDELRVELAGVSFLITLGDACLKRSIPASFPAFATERSPQWRVEVEGADVDPDTAASEAPVVHVADGSFRLVGMGVTAEVDLGERRARLAIPPSPHALAVVLRHVVPVAVEDGLVFHAALLAGGDRAWLCCGPSGAGKSTLARLLPDHARCDEMAAARFVGGEWHGEALPFWQSRPGRSPLEAVFLLRHGELNRRRQLDRRSAVRQLLPHLLWPTGSPPALDRALGLLCDLVDGVPVYDLEFLPRPDVFEVIARSPDQAAA